MERLYSPRSARIGSTREAERAGMSAALMAASSSTTIAAARLTGSDGLTPVNMPAMNRPAMKLKIRPAPMPNETRSSTWRSTILRMPIRSAPNVMRTPISKVRCATE